MLVHDLCMATKTISLELDAYEKLRRAKRTPGESFSNVVRRAQWENALPDARQVIEDLTALCSRHPEVLLAPRVLTAMDRRPRTARRRPAWEQ